MKKIINILFYIYTFLCLLLPASDLVISKKLIFMFLFAFGSAQTFLDKNLKFNKYNLLRILLLFLLLICGLFLSFSDKDGNPYFLIQACMPILLCVLLKDSVDVLKCIKVGGGILSLAVILLAILPTVSKPYSVAANLMFLNLNSGFLGERTFGALKLTMIHFRTSPILLIPFSLYFVDFCDKRKLRYFMLMCLNGAAIVLSASRGLILFSFLSVYAICFFNLREKRYRHFFFLFSVLALAGLSYVLSNTNIFDSKEESNSIKIGHIESFNDFTNENPLVLLFGKGTGSSYFSKGFGRMAWQTEVTFLDIVRYWGIFGCILFILIISIPQKKVSSKYILPFLFYYINAFTNPLIFNSTGMLVIAIYILMVSDKNSEKYLSHKRVLTNK